MYFMIRFILLLIIIFFLIQTLRSLFNVLRRRREFYQQRSSPFVNQKSYKNIEDADFEDITSKKDGE